MEELKSKLLEGEYGQTTLSPPSALVDQNGAQMVSVIDGKFILDNGKHFISALVMIGEVYDEVKAMLLAAAAAASPPPTKSQKQAGLSGLSLPCAACMKRASSWIFIGTPLMIGSHRPQCSACLMRPR